MIVSSAPHLQQPADLLFVLACWLSCAIWAGVGAYKLCHRHEMIEIIRSRAIPWPVAAYMASTAAELIGALLVGTQIAVTEGALIWLAFLLVVTPIFHGAVLRDGAIDYPHFVQLLKNLSIAGGLLALILIDLGRRSPPAEPFSAYRSGVVTPHAVNDQDKSQ